MSMDESTSEGSAGFGGKTDRRETNRFPVTEDVKYVVTHSKASKTRGSGKTLNFGSGGLLFTTEERLPIGRLVELSVTWPALLGGKCPLQFVATGRVVRSDNHRAAVKIQRYEFRTRGGATAAAAVAPASSPASFTNPGVR
jgi:c-di-GMP-binding flagellar brake protein YcgR